MKISKTKSGYSERAKMKTKFILDENGKISDSDPIYEKLSECYENDEFDKILETINEIPREIWSNRLWFMFIKTLSNKSELYAARKELYSIADKCKTSKDKGIFLYMLGHLCDMENKDIKALNFYKKAVEQNPSRDLTEDIKRCEKDLKASLEIVGPTLDCIIKDIDRFIRLVPNKNKLKPDENKLAFFIGLIPSKRNIECIDGCIDSANIFEKVDDNKKEALREWLFDRHKITDIKTYRKTCDGLFCINGRYTDMAAYMSGRPQFSPDKLKGEPKEAWDACKMFFKDFVERLPDGDVTAWDIGEKMGLLRWTYACDIISDSDYVLAVMELTDEIKKRYSSWREYLISYIFGSGMFLFCLNEYNIVSAMDFVSSVAENLLNSDIYKYKWIDSPRRTVRFDN